MNSDSFNCERYKKRSALFFYASLLFAVLYTGMTVIKHVMPVMVGKHDPFYTGTFLPVFLLFMLAGTLALHLHFIFWFGKSYRALERDEEMKRLAVSSWFIPFMNLYYPFKLLYRCASYCGIHNAVTVFYSLSVIVFWTNIPFVVILNVTAQTDIFKMFAVRIFSEWAYMAPCIIAITNTFLAKRVSGKVLLKLNPG